VRERCAPFSRHGQPENGRNVAIYDYLRDRQGKTFADGRWRDATSTRLYSTAARWTECRAGYQARPPRPGGSRLSGGAPRGGAGPVGGALGPGRKIRPAVSRARKGSGQTRPVEGDDDGPPWRPGLYTRRDAAAVPGLANHVQGVVTGSGLALQAPRHPTSGHAPSWGVASGESGGRRQGPTRRDHRPDGETATGPAEAPVMGPLNAGHRPGRKITPPGGPPVRPEVSCGNCFAPGPGGEGGNTGCPRADTGRQKPGRGPAARPGACYLCSPPPCPLAQGPGDGRLGPLGRPDRDQENLPPAARSPAFKCPRGVSKDAQGSRRSAGRRRDRGLRRGGSSSFFFFDGVSWFRTSSRRSRRLPQVADDGGRKVDVPLD